MIKTLTAKNFSVLSDTTLHFGDGINVICGENGCGKTHLLKLLYALSFGETALITERMTSVFESPRIESLIRRGQTKTQIALQFSTGQTDVSWKMGNDEVVSHSDVGKRSEIQGCFLSSVGWQFSFEPRSNFGRTSVKMKQLVDKLNVVLKGNVKKCSNGRLCLETEDGAFDAEQLSGGQKQLLRLAEWILTGTKRDLVVFWDLPEAGLNPKFCRTVAECLTALASEGTQIFLATHSVFLMRELYLQQVTESAPKKRPIRWIALTGRLNWQNRAMTYGN